MLDAAIDWHPTALLPLGPALTSDPRCRFVQGNFLPSRTGRKASVSQGRDSNLTRSSWRSILRRSSRSLAARLKPGGVFGPWSNDQPDAAFTQRLAGVFAEARDEPVTFHNPLQKQPFMQTIYLARTARGTGENA